MLPKPENVKRTGSLVVVSGLPRSGTSMMMQMLSAGGAQILTDEARPSDQGNPRGYFEFTPVKSLMEDADWLRHVPAGTAIKIVSYLLPYIPADVACRIVFMRRAMAGVLVSQQKMLVRMGNRANQPDDAVMAERFEAHLRDVATLIAERSNWECRYVDYESVLADPEKLAREIAEFSGLRLHAARMARAVEPALSHYIPPIPRQVGRLL